MADYAQGFFSDLMITVDVTDVTPRDMRPVARHHSDLMCSASHAPISNIRVDKLQEHSHCQLQSPPPNESSITEKEVLAEGHAHRSMRQAAESIYRAADAEENA